MQFKRREFVMLVGAVATIFSSQWPIAALGQQPERSRTIAILSGSANDVNGRSWISAFEDGLAASGWRADRNVHFERRFAAGDASKLQGLAKDLVQLKPDLILTNSTPGAMPNYPRAVSTVFEQLT
jgi:putative ABC transport system substrate-binding protein